LRGLGWLRALAALPHWARIALVGVFAPAFEHRPRQIVQGVIEGEGGVLLAVRWELRGWELPGGNLEPGETDVEALRREIAEEVGVEVEVGEPVGEYVRTGFLPHTARVYRCRIVRGAPTPSEESPQCEWFPRDAPPAELLAWCRRPLEDALAGGPSVRREEAQGVGRILDTMRIDLRMRARGEPARSRPREAERPAGTSGRGEGKERIEDAGRRSGR